MKRDAARAGLLERLVREHQASLRRYTGDLTRDAALADDIVQEALLRLWHDRRVTDETHARRWLYVTCRNLALDRRKVRSRRAAVLRELPPPAASVGAEAESLVAARQQLEALLAVLGELPDAQREVVRLRLQGGLSYGDIAEVLGTTTSNVGVLLHRAMTALREGVLDRGGAEGDGSRRSA